MNKFNKSFQSRPSREKMQNVIEIAKKITSQPFQLTDEEREHFKRVVIEEYYRE